MSQYLHGSRKIATPTPTCTPINQHTTYYITHTYPTPRCPLYSSLASQFCRDGQLRLPPMYEHLVCTCISATSVCMPLPCRQHAAHTCPSPASSADRSPLYASPHLPCMHPLQVPTVKGCTLWPLVLPMVKPSVPTGVTHRQMGWQVRD